MYNFIDDSYYDIVNNSNDIKDYEIIDFKHLNKIKKQKEITIMTPNIDASNFDSLPNIANVRLPVVMALLGVSAATVWRMVKLNKIPQPRKLTVRTTTWNVGELREFLK
jgi:predicted DNA-binding transcriptional regulator AlpA